MTPAIHCTDYPASRLVVKTPKYILNLLGAVSIVGLKNRTAVNETHEWEDPYRGRVQNNTVKPKLQQTQKLSVKIHLHFK
jgi:hypothetical protein